MATITVINADDSGAGSLRDALANASAGDIINFAPFVTVIDLASSLVISKNVTIEGAQPGSTMPGVAINGGAAGSNFSDFTINAGVTATIDGLVIANGHGTGATGDHGSNSTIGQAGGTGGAAAGGIFDAGSLTLTNSWLTDDTATGGTGGKGGLYGGGGAGGAAAGAIYVTSTGTLHLAANDSFSNNSATGGTGGQGGYSLLFFPGGAGGQGGVSGVNYGIGAPGSSVNNGGAGGAPGHAGSPSHFGSPYGGGGGGGGSAFADIAGAGTITAATLVVTNNSDDVNTVGSLRYELAHAGAYDKIVFDPSVTTIDLTSSLVIDKNITIEGAQPGSTAPGVTIDGGGSTSNFSDFTINGGVSATFDGLIIADGHGTGTTGSSGVFYQAGGRGGAAGGGIFDAGTLTLTNSVLNGDTATGGAGGTGGRYGGGGAGGNAAGGIYVAGTGTLNLAASDSFSNDSATGGTGGTGGGVGGFGGAGGQGGVSGVNNGTGGYGSHGPLGFDAGGAPGQPGSPGSIGFPGSGGGGGGGFAFGDVGGAGTINGPVPCYCPGTLIETPRGTERVETLKIGDEVMTASGVARPVKWIGRRSYGGRFVMGHKDVLPVCIKAGALDENVPRRDLWISPRHAMYLDGVLIEAKDLVNGASIVQAERVETVEYFHVELDTHDVIIAEGAASETYLDDDNRLMFHNAQDYYTRYRHAAVAAPYCAPRLEDGYEVETVRQRIAARAGLSRNATSERPTIKVHRRAGAARSRG